MHCGHMRFSLFEHDGCGASMMIIYLEVVPILIDELCDIFTLGHDYFGGHCYHSCTYSTQRHTYPTIGGSLR